MEWLGQLGERHLAARRAHDQVQRARVRAGRQREPGAVVAQSDVGQERELEQVLLGRLQGRQRRAVGGDQPHTGRQRQPRSGHAIAVAARLGAGPLDGQRAGQVRRGQRAGGQGVAEIVGQGQHQRTVLDHRGAKPRRGEEVVEQREPARLGQRDGHRSLELLDDRLEHAPPAQDIDPEGARVDREKLGSLRVGQAEGRQRRGRIGAHRRAEAGVVERDDQRALERVMAHRDQAARMRRKLSTTCAGGLRSHS
jgi:hypothetical protein